MYVIPDVEKRRSARVRNIKIVYNLGEEEAMLYHLYVNQNLYVNENDIYILFFSMSIGSTYYMCRVYI
jgi:hypothetical protein